MWFWDLGKWYIVILGAYRGSWMVDVDVLFRRSGYLRCGIDREEGLYRTEEMLYSRGNTVDDISKCKKGSCD